MRKIIRVKDEDYYYLLLMYRSKLGIFISVCILWKKSMSEKEKEKILLKRFKLKQGNEYKVSNYRSNYNL
jgi:hypothetical protein